MSEETKESTTGKPTSYGLGKNNQGAENLNPTSMTEVSAVTLQLEHLVDKKPLAMNTFVQASMMPLDEKGETTALVWAIWDNNKNVLYEAKEDVKSITERAFLSLNYIHDHQIENDEGEFQISVFELLGLTKSDESQKVIDILSKIVPENPSFLLTSINTTNENAEEKGLDVVEIGDEKEKDEPTKDK